MTTYPGGVGILVCFEKMAFEVEKPNILQFFDDLGPKNTPKFGFRKIFFKILLKLIEIHYIETFGSGWLIFWLFRTYFKVFRPLFSLYIYITKPVIQAIPGRSLVGVKS